MTGDTCILQVSENTTTTSLTNLKWYVGWFELKKPCSFSCKQPRKATNLSQFTCVSLVLPFSLQRKCLPSPRLDSLQRKCLPNSCPNSLLMFSTFPVPYKKLSLGNHFPWLFLWLIFPHKELKAFIPKGSSYFRSD